MVSKVKIFLGISVALNLLFLGVLLGFFAKGCRRHGPPNLPPRALQGQLSPEHEKLFLEAMKSLHENNRDTEERIESTRSEILDILTAPQFNASAYQEKTNQLHELHGKMKSQMTQVVLELAAKLSPEERQALAGFLEKGPPSQEGRHRRGPPPRGPHGRPEFPGPPSETQPWPDPRP